MQTERDELRLEFRDNAHAFILLKISENHLIGKGMLYHERCYKPCGHRLRSSDWLEDRMNKRKVYNQVSCNTDKVDSITSAADDSIADVDATEASVDCIEISMYAAVDSAIDVADATVDSMIDVAETEVCSAVFSKAFTAQSTHSDEAFSKD